jgi:opine dehydrogenase
LGYRPYSYDEIFRASLGDITFEEFAAGSSKGPFSMQDRYVTEDIPMGATLTTSLARKVGVSTPTYDSMIHLASVVNDTNYFAMGRNLENLGLAHLTLEQMETYLQTGQKP